MKGLLSCLDPDSRQQLLAAVTALSASANPRSNVRAACLRFQAGLVAAPASWYLLTPELVTAWLQVWRLEACPRYEFTTYRGFQGVSALTGRSSTNMTFFS